MAYIYDLWIEIRLDLVVDCRLLVRSCSSQQVSCYLSPVLLRVVGWVGLARGCFAVDHCPPIAVSPIETHCPHVTFLHNYSFKLLAVLRNSYCYILYNILAQIHSDVNKDLTSRPGPKSWRSEIFYITPGILLRLMIYFFRYFLAGGRLLNTPLELVLYLWQHTHVAVKL